MLKWIEHQAPPLKYGIILAIAMPLSRLLGDLTGLGDPVDAIDLLLSAIIGGLVGYGLGYLKKRYSAKT